MIVYRRTKQFRKKKIKLKFWVLYNNNLKISFIKNFLRALLSILKKTLDKQMSASLNHLKTLCK